MLKVADEVLTAYTELKLACKRVVAVRVGPNLVSIAGVACSAAVCTPYDIGVSRCYFRALTPPAEGQAGGQADGCRFLADDGGPAAGAKLQLLKAELTRELPAVRSLGRV